MNIHSAFGVRRRNLSEIDVASSIPGYRVNRNELMADINELQACKSLV